MSWATSQYRCCEVGGELGGGVHGSGYQSYKSSWNAAIGETPYQQKIKGNAHDPYNYEGSMVAMSATYVLEKKRMPE